MGCQCLPYTAVASTKLLVNSEQVAEFDYSGGNALFVGSKVLDKYRIADVCFSRLQRWQIQWR